MIRPVVTHAREPSASKLVITRYVVTLPALQSAGLLSPAPDELRPPHERMINSAIERLPSDRGIGPIQPRAEPARIEIVDDARCVVALRVGKSKIDICVIRYV